MNLQKQVSLAVALTALLSVAGCRKNSTSTEQTTAGPAESAERQHPEGGVTAATETKFFKGSIGSALGLQMKLVREGQTSWDGVRNYQARNNLKAMKAGDRDTMVPLAPKLRLAAAIPGARIVVVPASGHATPYDQPATFNRVLLEFLAQH